MKASDIKLPAHDQDEIDVKMEKLHEEISEAIKDQDQYFVLVTEEHSLTGEPAFEMFGDQEWITDIVGLYEAMVEFMEGGVLTPTIQKRMNDCGLAVENDKHFCRSEWKISHLKGVNEAYENEIAEWQGVHEDMHIPGVPIYLFDEDGNKVKAIVEKFRKHHFQGMKFKSHQVGADTIHFFIKHSDGSNVKNANKNIGVSFGVLLTGERGRKPLNGNPFDLRFINWQARL